MVNKSANFNRKFVKKLKHIRDIKRGKIKGHRGFNLLNKENAEEVSKPKSTNMRNREMSKKALKKQARIDKNMDRLANEMSLSGNFLKKKNNKRRGRKSNQIGENKDMEIDIEEDNN